MHRAGYGEHAYLKSKEEYMEDFRQVIAQKIEDDHAGTFDVI